MTTTTATVRLTGRTSASLRAHIAAGADTARGSKIIAARIAARGAKERSAR